MNMDITELAGDFNIVSMPRMAHVVFANNPKNRTENNNSTCVRAEITYLDRNKKLLFTLQGRWSQMDQIRGEQNTSIESTDFPNNGASRALDTLMKYPEDNYCYGYNNDSDRYPYFQNPQYEIKDNLFFIHIILKGAYIPNRVWEFEVETKGKKDTFSIRYGKQWTRLENTFSEKVKSKTKINSVCTQLG